MVNMQFGVFGICDGHGGAAAAKSASKSVILIRLNFPILLCALHHDFLTKYYHFSCLCCNLICFFQCLYIKECYKFIKTISCPLSFSRQKAIACFSSL